MPTMNDPEIGDINVMPEASFWLFNTWSGGVVCGAGIALATYLLWCLG